MKIKNYRDWLALFLAVLVFPGIWVMQGLSIIEMPGEIIGATVAIETLIAQFYWRKANEELH